MILEPVKLPPSTDVIIPQLFYSIREKIDLIALPLAQEAEKNFPDGRFGVKKYEHMNDLADQAGAIAKIEGFTPHEAGLMMIILKSHDIGRHIASLPPGKRSEILPEQQRAEFDQSEAYAQREHALLSAVFLTKNHLLKELSANDSSIVIDAILEHSKINLSLKPNHPAYKFAKLARELDQIELVSRRDFLTAQGALDQFIQWGAPKFGYSKEAASEILNAPENAKLLETTKRFLQRAFENSINDLGLMRNELTRIGRTEPLANAISAWFLSPEQGRGLLDPKCLEIVKEYLNGNTKTLPSIDKDLMTDNYANYMFSHFMIALQIDSASGNNQILKSNGGLAARLLYLNCTEPKIIGIIHECIRPMIKIMRAKATHLVTSSAAA